MNALTCVSITEVEKSPYWMYKMDDRGTLRPVLEQGCEYFQRQGLPTVYQLNGAVYVSDVNWLRKSRKFVSLETVGYVMPEQRSFDIDNFVDFRICDLMLRDRNRETLA